MLTSIAMSQKSIDARCAQPSMLHFLVQELNATEKAESQVGHESNSNEPEMNLENLIFDGEQMQRKLQQTIHSRRLSSKVQVKTNSQCVQLRL